MGPVDASLKFYLSRYEHSKVFAMKETTGANVPVGRAAIVVEVGEAVADSTITVEDTETGGRRGRCPSWLQD